MKIDEKLIEKTIKEYRQYAEKHGFRLNPNEKIVRKMVEALLKKEETYGCRYCPCRVISGDKQEDSKKICPCSAHLDEIKKHGHCLCHLFVR